MFYGFYEQVHSDVLMTRHVRVGADFDLTELPVRTVGGWRNINTKHLFEAELLAIGRFALNDAQDRRFILWVVQTFDADSPARNLDHWARHQNQFQLDPWD